MQRGCTQCGECLDVCPVYRRLRREEYSPKAKRLLLEPLCEDFADPANAGISWEQSRELARLCAGCGRCQKACARKLSTADLLAAARAAHPHWTQSLWDLWIKRMGPAWLSLGYLACAVPGRYTPDMLKPMLGMAKALVDRSVGPVWATLTKDPAAQVDDSLPVVLFPGCTATHVRGAWTKKAEALLKAWGYTVLSAPGFGCCGATMHHAGRFKTQKRMEEHNIELWRELGRPRVAVFCASCRHGLSSYGDTALHGAEAETWKRNVTPLSALLHGATATQQAEKPAQYGYHQPCHWDVDTDILWLKTLFGGQMQGKEPCCGMGGILQMENAALSRQMAKACLDGFPSSVKHILTGCSGCVMQLNATAPRGVTVSHWLDVVSVD